ncbi:hypothetical protein CRENBAI_008409 [Crenichthys baileyi]|uniref:Uncharacterized protein n=1 Tax=Crenichthys baileyi TaxID=28760 RepID=A0AAV9S876_9TELE
MRTRVNQNHNQPKAEENQDTFRCFAFIGWEDGYTRDEAPVLQDLRSGDPVLAKWSDALPKGVPLVHHSMEVIHPAHHSMASTPLVHHPVEAIQLTHQLLGSVHLTAEKQLAWHHTGEMQAAHSTRATSHMNSRQKMHGQHVMDIQARPESFRLLAAIFTIGPAGALSWKRRIHLIVPPCCHESYIKTTLHASVSCTF